MTIIKVIKIPRPFKKKQDKRYPCTNLGYINMLWDSKKAKEAKISGIISLIVLIAFFTFGLISKEIFIMFLTGKGINKAANWMIG